jgi:hypothetical protein
MESPLCGWMGRQRRLTSHALFRFETIRTEQREYHLRIDKNIHDTSEQAHGAYGHRPDALRVQVLL